MNEALVDFLAPWESLYADSTLLSTAVLAVHLVALLVAGGLAISGDRSTLRARDLPLEQRAILAQQLHELHRPVITALAFLLLSGLLMVAADLEALGRSTVFWTKMTAVVLLVLNGARLYRTSHRLLRGAEPAANARDWDRLATSARISVGLWIGITILGAALTAAG